EDAIALLEGPADGLDAAPRAIRDEADRHAPVGADAVGLRHAVGGIERLQAWQLADAAGEALRAGALVAVLPVHAGRAVLARVRDAVVDVAGVGAVVRAHAVAVVALLAGLHDLIAALRRLAGVGTGVRVDAIGV